MSGCITKSVIKVLLDETFKCETQSITCLRRHKLRRRTPLPTTLRLRRTGPRLHFSYPYFICSHIMEMLIERR